MQQVNSSGDKVISCSTLDCNFHQLMLHALRQREQDVLKFVAILAPALAGFVWLTRELGLAKCAIRSR